MALGTPTDGGASYSAQNGTSVAPSYPSGIQADDCLVLIVGQKPSTANSGTVTTPTGWTLQSDNLAAGGYGTTLGADTGNTNLRIYTKNTVDGNETGTLSVTIGTNNVSWAVIVRIPTSGGTLSYQFAEGSRTTTPTSSLSVALSPTISAQTGDKFINAMCIPTDVTTPGQFTNTGVSITGLTETDGELEEPDSGTGNDIGGFVGYSHVDSGTASGTATFTATLAGTLTNVRGPVSTLLIRETLAERTGTFDATEGAADSFSASGEVLVSGALSVSETGNDTFSASGSVTDQTNSGSLAVTETGTDTFSSTGDIIVKGALSVSETGNDTFSASGDVIVKGSLSVTETGTDIFSGTGSALLVSTGSLNATEANDTLTASGTVLIKGVITALEIGSDTFTSIGVTTEQRSGSMSATEASDFLGSYVVDNYVESGYSISGWEGFVYYEIPLPSTVTAGVRYGPNGAYVGTATGGGTGTRIEITSGKIVKLVGSTGALLIS